MLADGFAAFLYNGGRMRLIINDVLSEEDRNAIVVGESEVNTPYFDLNAIDCISYTLSKRDKHFFECLSWLIKNERIEIKIITPKVGNGIAHSKCGMFSDGISKVAFDGSCNFSRMDFVIGMESETRTVLTILSTISIVHSLVKMIRSSILKLTKLSRISQRPINIRI